MANTQTHATLMCTVSINLNADEHLERCLLLLLCRTIISLYKILNVHGQMSNIYLYLSDGIFEILVEMNLF